MEKLFCDSWNIKSILLKHCIFSALFCAVQTSALKTKGLEALEVWDLQKNVAVGLDNSGHRWWSEESQEKKENIKHNRVQTVAISQSYLDRGEINNYNRSSKEKFEAEEHAGDVTISWFNNNIRTWLDYPGIPKSLELQQLKERIPWW